MVDFRKLCTSLLSYSTVKVVHINDWRLGIVHYTITLAILFYVVGYVIFFDSGYQSMSPVVGYTATKVKGSALQAMPGLQNMQVFDSIDLIIPPSENSALFVATNVFSTMQQSRGTWPDWTTNSTQGCAAGNFTDWGIMNGKEAGDYCEIFGWGPVEEDEATTQATVLENVQNWTVFLRCSVYFSDYEIREDNIGDELTPDVYHNVVFRHHHVQAPLIAADSSTADQVAEQNLFLIADMLEQAGTTFDEAAVEGAIISVTISWSCSFDPWSRPCEPEFIFDRLDDPNQSFSKGFNFRYANYYWLPMVNTTDGGNSTNAGDITLTPIEYRDLFKVYGLRFVFIVTGAGYKFNIVPLFLKVNIGSGLGLLVIATVITDMLAVYIFPQKKKYHDAKFQDIGMSVNREQDLDEDDVDYGDDLEEVPGTTSAVAVTAGDSSSGLVHRKGAYDEGSALLASP